MQALLVASVSSATDEANEPSTYVVQEYLYFQFWAVMVVRSVAWDGARRISGCQFRRTKDAPQVQRPRGLFHNNLNVLHDGVSRVA